jgi:hypothetical protein
VTLVPTVNATGPPVLETAIVSPPGAALPIQLNWVMSNRTFGCLINCASSTPRWTRPSTVPSCGST